MKKINITHPSTLFDGGANILSLETQLKKRFGVIQRVGVLKKKLKLPEMDQKRWEEVSQRIKTKAKEKGLDEEFIAEYWDAIHDIAIRIEQNTKKSNTEDTLDQLRSEIDMIDEAILSVLQMIAEQNKGDKFQLVATQTLNRIKQTLGI